VGDLPPLPQVATRVMELIQNSKTTVKDLEQIIAKDQALTGKVLRISNSAFYGVRGEISTLSRAIVVLGFNALRSVVLTGASESLHQSAGSGFKDKMLWEHSLAVALAARTIAEECRYDAAEEAYVGGLLHDVGKVVLDVNLTEDYHEVLERVYNDRMPFIDAENEVLGFDHTDVGAMVVDRWSLASGLAEAVRLHHQPMGAEIDPTLCAVISLANSVCVKLGIGPERDPELNLVELESTLMLTLAPDRLNEIAAAVKNRLSEEKTQLSLA
jgi:putative nucleotidyltransferase with HDIG domain